MARLTLFKNDSGKLEGFGDANRRGYQRFVDFVARMEPGTGELIRFEWKAPRSIQFHKRFFVQLHKLFERQEQFASEDALRTWLTIGAGECEFVPGPKGVMCAMPKSIAFENMDDIEFFEFVTKVDAFLWTAHAQRYLWPHLDDKQTFAMIEQLRDEMDSGHGKMETTKTDKKRQ